MCLFGGDLSRLAVTSKVEIEPAIPYGFLVVANKPLIHLCEDRRS